MDYKLKYYRGNNLLTKKYLVDIIKDKAIYSNYLPDGINLNNLSKSFLFCVSIYIIFQLIANLEPQVYTNLYKIYKLKEAQKGNKKWNEYEINIASNVANKIAIFQPTNR